MALTVLYETLFIPLGNFQQRTTENGMCPVISQGKENCMVLTDSASEWKLEYQILSVTVFSVRRHSQVSSRSAATWQAASGFALSWTAPGPVWNGHRRLSGISSGMMPHHRRAEKIARIAEYLQQQWSQKKDQTSSLTPIFTSDDLHVWNSSNNGAELVFFLMKPNVH